MNDAFNSQLASLSSLRDRLEFLLDGGRLTLDKWQGAHYIAFNLQGELIQHDVIQELNFYYPVEKLEFISNWKPYLEPAYARS